MCFEKCGGRKVSGNFSGANNRITSANYAYDTRGNLTADGAHSYVYGKVGLGQDRRTDPIIESRA